MFSATNSEILKLDTVCFSYDKNKAFIRDLAFSIKEGDFIGLLGANGSGKSTILKLATGILKPLSGSLTIWGTNLAAVSNKDRAKLISYLPQSLDISVPFTVSELVSMGIYPYDILPTMTVEEALDMAGLREKANARLSDLSGGERRRTFIAMTLLQGAGLILLDEPFANLDIKYQVELVKLLKNLRETRGISVMMALHDINMAFQFQKIILIKGGVIIGVGRPEEVLTRDFLKQAFDVDVDVRQSGMKGTYISIENNF
jgi:ABC-type cobalamin/Fe3+-siderophores transport system ATPase subunit